MFHLFSHDCVWLIFRVFMFPNHQLFLLFTGDLHLHCPSPPSYLLATNPYFPTHPLLINKSPTPPLHHLIVWSYKAPLHLLHHFLLTRSPPSLSPSPVSLHKSPTLPHVYEPPLPTPPSLPPLYYYKPISNLPCFLSHTIGLLLLIVAAEPWEVVKLAKEFW